MRSISIASDGSVAAACNNAGHVFMWDPSALPASSEEGEKGDPKQVEAEKFKSFRAHNTYAIKCTISPDTNLLATASADHTVKLWRLADANHVKTLASHQRWVWDCAFSADSSYLVTASSDHTARLWELGRGEVIRHYSGHHKAVVCVALNDN